MKFLISIARERDVHRRENISLSVQRLNLLIERASARASSRTVELIVASGVVATASRETRRRGGESVDRRGAGGRGLKEKKFTVPFVAALRWRGRRACPARG